MRSRHTRLRPRRLAALLALLAAALGSGTAGAAPTPPPDDPALAQSVAPDEAAASGPAVIDVGHVDVGPRVVDGQWQVMARDDSGPAPVWRDPARTALHVTDAALMDAPTDPAYDFMGGRAGERWYVVAPDPEPRRRLAGLEHPGPRRHPDRAAGRHHEHRPRQRPRARLDVPPERHLRQAPAPHGLPDKGAPGRVGGCQHPRPRQLGL